MPFRDDVGLDDSGGPVEAVTGVISSWPPEGYVASVGPLLDETGPRER
jgi:hypothetical protein